MTKLLKLASIGVIVGLMGVHTAAQQPKPAPAPPTLRDQIAAQAQTAAAARTAIVPLSVRVVITRTPDGKAAVSRPYELSVPANDKAGASLTNATQILIPMVTVQEKTTGPVYKDVGTKVECSAMSLDGGRFRLSLTVEDESVMPDTKLPSDGVRGPWLETFRAEQVLVLKDGQTTEFASGIDRSTGELVKAAVTLTVVK